MNLSSPGLCRAAAFLERSRSKKRRLAQLLNFNTEAGNFHCLPRSAAAAELGMRHERERARWRTSRRRRTGRAVRWARRAPGRGPPPSAWIGTARRSPPSAHAPETRQPSFAQRRRGPRAAHPRAHARSARAPGAPCRRWRTSGLGKVARRRAVAGVVLAGGGNTRKRTFKTVAKHTRKTG